MKVTQVHCDPLFLTEMGSFDGCETFSGTSEKDGRSRLEERLSVSHANVEEKQGQKSQSPPFQGHRLCLRVMGDSIGMGNGQGSGHLLCLSLTRGVKRETEARPTPLTSGSTLLTSRSLCRLRNCTSQSGSRFLSPWRLSKTRGSDSFSFSASYAGIQSGLSQKVRGARREKKKCREAMGEKGHQEKGKS
jgi:hypothetical protein